jgi:hypothetical protein
MRTIRQVWVVFLCAAFLFTSSYSLAAPFEPQQQQQQQGEDPNAANLTPQEIDNLVAPIALYPDALVAQVLAAATYPDQIVEADKWVKANPSLKDQALLTAVDKQPWDPSVKALTQFPSVLDNMVQNLAWTSALGEAYYYQQGDVMASVQRLRKEAKAAGNLKSSSELKVVQQDPQTIVIQPAQPTVVYVPQYNPTVVYGTPYYPPGYSTGAMVATGLISFGVGMAIGASMNNGCCGWGWGYGGWGCNWRGGTVVYNRNVYVSRSAVYAGGRRPDYYNRATTYNNGNRYNGGNNRYNQNSNNRYGNNRNTNVSGNTINRGGNNTVNINTGGNNNGNRPNQNRPNNNNNGNLNASNRPNAGNRPNGGNTPQTRPAAADRGYGQQRQASTNSGAFSGYDKGGNTRAQADRGRTSMNSGGGRQGAARQGGGGRRK